MTVGSTVLSPTGSRWSLSGETGHLQDSEASTSPAIMHAGWQSLLLWLNSHEHSNGNDGNDTGGRHQRLTGVSLNDGYTTPMVTFHVTSLLSIQQEVSMLMSKAEYARHRG